MASNNNDSAGLFWLAVLALVVLYFLAFILFTIAAFAALVMTLVAFFAWNDDLHIGRLVIDTDDARFFVYSASHRRGKRAARLTRSWLLYRGHAGVLAQVGNGRHA